MGTRYLVLVILAGCIDLGNPVVPIPDDAVRFNPPPVYRTYWSETENSTGIKGNFDAITWMYEPDGHPIPTPEGGAGGLGCWWNNTIVLTWINLGHAPLVRHEIIHILTRSGRHPHRYFDDGQGGKFILPPKTYSD